LQEVQKLALALEQVAQDWWQEAHTRVEVLKKKLLLHTQEDGLSASRRAFVLQLVHIEVSEMVQSPHVSGQTWQTLGVGAGLRGLTQRQEAGAFPDSIAGE